MLAIVLGDDESGGQQSLDGFGRLAELVEHVAPAVRCIPDAEALGGGAVDTPTLDVVDGLRRVLEAGLPVTGHGVEERKQLVIAACRFVAFVARDLYAHRVGEAFDRLDETHVIVFHQETDRGAVRAAAEAVVETLGGTHRKRRRLFIVERAAGLELAARLLELHAATDDLDDIRAGNQVVDKILGDQSGHTDVNVARSWPGLGARVIAFSTA